MDKIKAFLNAMTIWNWLTLTAFLVLPLSALNAFLNLKSRYKDWNGKRSKAKFEKRTEQLQNQLTEIHEYRTSPTKLLVVTMDYLAGALYMFVIAFLAGVGMFISSQSTFNNPTASKISFVMFSIFTLYSVLRALIRLYRLRTLVYRVEVPESVGKSAIALMHTAKFKGWIAEDDDSIITNVLNHVVFTDTERMNLKTFDGVQRVKRITAIKMKLKSF